MTESEENILLCPRCGTILTIYQGTDEAHCVCGFVGWKSPTSGNLEVPETLNSSREVRVPVTAPRFSQRAKSEIDAEASEVARLWNQGETYLDIGASLSITAKEVERAMIAAQRRHLVPKKKYRKRRGTA